MDMKRSHVLTGAAVIAACILLIIVGFHYSEKFFADRNAVAAIGPGMSRSNVVQLLGVMYDDAKPGEYADVDSVLSRMQGNEDIAHLSSWRIRNSRELFWVGFDDRDSVISVTIQKK